MTDLTAALDRLTRAVDRLEAAAEQCIERNDDEKRRLSAELKILHAEYAGLSGITAEVTRNLDDTISRLANVLENSSDLAPESSEHGEAGR